MPLLKDGALIDDPWVHVADEQDLPSGGAVIVGLRRWRENKAALMACGHRLGVRLSSEQTPGEIADDLAALDLVALEFPVFTDGRPYSNARRLRERYGFKGELRAVGDILRDQYVLLARCGFDALEVADGETVGAWRAAVDAITTPMQPAADGASTALSLRERRRMAS